MAIDEIQRVPALLRAIKTTLDEDRCPGRFIATGSSNLMNLKGVEKSLAGRAEALLCLYTVLAGGNIRESQKTLRQTCRHISRITTETPSK